jgi:hypothetical protein
MTRVGMILMAVSMLAAGGTLEVLRSGSRVDAATIRLLQSRLEDTPQTVGAWGGRDYLYDQKMLDRAEAQAHLYRVYSNPTTKEEIAVLILAGNPREIGAHDPTVCFRGNGLQLQGEERTQEVGPDKFWMAQFSSQSFPTKMEVFWAWGTQGRWTAPKNARYEYGSEPLLLKIYVSRVIGGPTPTEKFLDDFLPMLKAAVDPATP